jgi:beta-lactamase class A
MITQAPIPDQQIPQNVSEVQAAEQLEREDTKQLIKEIYLRHFLKKAINQNEAESVLTGVTVKDLQSDRTVFSHNQNTEHFAASVNKVPIALLVLEELRAGRLNLDQMVTWQETDRRGGFGLYDQPGAPLQAPLRDVLYDMLNRSGNTVVRGTVNYLLGGAAAVNARWAAEPQLSHTYLIILDESRFYLGNSTPHDSMWALQQLLKGQDSYTDFMKDALTTNIFSDFGVRTQLQNSDFIVLTNKIGLLDDVEGNNRHDVGIIYNKRTNKSYGYSFFTTSPFDSPTATPRADQSLKDMGLFTLRYAGDKKRFGGKGAGPLHELRQNTPEHKTLY